MGRLNSGWRTIFFVLRQKVAYDRLFSTLLNLEFCINLLSGLDPLNYQLLRDLGFPAILTDLQGTICLFNTKAEALLGWKVEEVEGKSVLEVTVSSDQRENAAEILASLQTGSSWEGLFPVLSKSGKIHHLYVSNSPVRNEAGELVGILGLFPDPDRLQGVEKQLLELNYILNRSESLSRTGSWTWDFIRDRPVWSDQMLKVVGLHAGQSPPTQKEFRERIHPEDVAAYRSAREQGLKDGHFEHTFRFYRFGDDALRFFYFVGEFLFDTEGAPVGQIGHCQDVTEQMEQKEALVRERDFNAALLEQNAVLIMVLDRQNQIIHFNRACEELSGYSEVEVLGKDPNKFLVLPEDIREEEHRRRKEGESVPADGVENSMLWAWQVRELEAVKAGKRTPAPSRKNWISRDGRTRLIEWMPAVIHDEAGNPTALVGTGYDITEQEAQRQELYRTRERMRLAIRGSGGGIWTLENSPDPEPRLFRFDARAAGLLEIEARDFQESFSEFLERVHPRDRDSLSNYFQGLFANPERERETRFRVRRKDGDWRWIRASGQGLKKSSESGAMATGLFWDHTSAVRDEQKRLEEQKLQALGTLAGGVAHDFNNILQGIMGLAEMGKRKSETEVNERAFREIIKASQRAAGVIQQILAFSRTMDAAFEPLSLKELVEASLPLIRAANQPGIVVEADYGEPPYQIEGDPGQLQQMLLNLCLNAVQAMEEEGGVLRISLEGQAGEGGPGGQVSLTVSDTGAGMPTDVMRRMFEPYYSTRREVGGTGLGLSMVDGIVKLHKGEIEVESSEGKGTTLRIRFPAVEALSENLADAIEEPGVNWNVKGKKSMRGKILILDDEELVLIPLQAGLEDLGFEIASFTDPQEALTCFQKDPDGYQLIITDMTMPGMNGIQFSEKVREQREDIPILISTGYNHQMNSSDIRGLGKTDFLYKPYAFEELEEKIRELLQG